MGLFVQFKKDKGEKKEDADLAGIIDDAANEALAEMGFADARDTSSYDSEMGFSDNEKIGSEAGKEVEREVEGEVEKEVKKEMDSEEFRENIEEEIKKKFGFLG